jgi:hypothetical protein
MLNYFKVSGFIFISFLFVFIQNNLYSEINSPSHIPRTILGIYHSKAGEDFRFHPLHVHFEMPLNHLGLKLEYWDLEKGIPHSLNLSDVRGVLAYFSTDAIPMPEEFIFWANELIEKGKKFVLMGNVGFEYNLSRRPVNIGIVNLLLKKIGLYWNKEWETSNLNYEYVKNSPYLFDFEKKLSMNIDSYPKLKSIYDTTKICLGIKNNLQNNPPDVLVSISPNGGYAASGNYLFDNGKNQARWLMNPFLFFENVFATNDLPKPDTTTLSGKRIFYAHIDGDGWQSQSTAEDYDKKNFNCAEVIKREMLLKYPELPVTIAPVAADIDPHWFGSNELVQQAKEIFSFPQVSAASHGYTHILDWAFYDVKNPKEKEKKLYNVTNDLKTYFSLNQSYNKKTENGYTAPRSYLFQDFNLNRELYGAVQFIQTLTPLDKKVNVIQWTGNCVPFDAALKTLKDNNLYNINGGDTRFDNEFPSYAFVSPLGRSYSSGYQIYASNSNENTYTSDWTSNFSGFRKVIETYQNTEAPKRIKPANLYFHFYSAEKTASLYALQKIMSYIKAQNWISISMPHFVSIANDFYKISFQKLNERKFLVQNKGMLSTVRFDYASDLSINYNESTGVLGAIHCQGSLYISLDKKVNEPIIALLPYDEKKVKKQRDPVFLLGSNWDISNLFRNQDEFHFTGSGFGKASIDWRVPESGKYLLKAQIGKKKNRTNLCCKR